MKKVREMFVVARVTPFAQTVTELNRTGTTLTM